MLNLSSRLQPNREEIAAKVMDGEAIIINLTTGVYYSMDKVGGLVWDLIEGGNSMEEIVEFILSRYDVGREQAKADVERLAAELMQEKLVLESNGEVTPPERKIPEQDKLPYEPPKLNIYHDMGDLLALDPPTPGLENLP
jgi:hypothetical protein